MCKTHFNDYQEFKEFVARTTALDYKKIRPVSERGEWTHLPQDFPGKTIGSFDNPEHDLRVQLYWVNEYTQRWGLPHYILVQGYECWVSDFQNCNCVTAWDVLFTTHPNRTWIEPSHNFDCASRGTYGEASLWGGSHDPSEVKKLLTEVRKELEVQNEEST